MEVIQQQKIGHRQMQKILLSDKQAYVESVGKHERRTAGDIFSHETGAGTVLRVFFGATRSMPLRGLGYVVAAQEIARHIPHEQLQIVFVNELGDQINGIDRGTSRKQALLVRDLFRRQQVQPDKLTFTEDTSQDMIGKIEPDIRELIAGDKNLHDKLSAKGQKHGSDFVRYGAAHVVHQETALMVPMGLTDTEPVAIQPSRIVSVGCQQEHLFYDLRSKARAALAGLDYVPSTQIFTKHVLPPYYISRNGEQSLAEALNFGVDLSQIGDMSAERDVKHLLSVIPQEEIKL